MRRISYINPGHHQSRRLGEWRFCNLVLVGLILLTLPMLPSRAERLESTGTNAVTDTLPVDLSLYLFEGPDPVATGNQLVFSFSLKNLGNADASSVVVSDQLPVDTVFVSCWMSGGTCSGPPIGTNGLVTLSVPTLQATYGFTLGEIVVKVTAPPGTELENTASVACAAPDLDPSNNSDSTTTDVVPYVVFGNVKRLTAGARHTLALKNDGTVWSWGGSDGTTSVVPTYPTQVDGLSNVVAISAGNGFSLALKADGSVWGWGTNLAGQLGIGSVNFSASPAQVHNITSVRSIAAGDSHALALLNDGTVWAWGNNQNGELGDGTQTYRFEPVQVSGLTNVTSVSAGTNYSIAARSDGTVWAWGWNKYGQAVPESTTQSLLSPVQASSVSNVRSVSGGYDYSLALKNNGEVWAWGSNSNGQLGVNGLAQGGPLRVPGMTGVVACGAAGPSVALKSDGTVWTWGYLGNTQPDFTPVWVSDVSGAVGVAAGLGFGGAVLADGSVSMWGNDNYYQLGDGYDSFRTNAMPVLGITNVNPPSFVIHPLNDSYLVVIHCYTPGATVHYTENGNEPTENDPALNPASNSALIFDSTTVLKAKAWKPGWTPSSVRTVTITIQSWLDNAQNFVTQHYSDFLNRQPDSGGLYYWTSQITQCGADSRCVLQQRISVSAAFFIELEFQQTGSVVYRIYRAAYGASPNAPTRANVTYSQFINDRSQLVGGSGLAQSTINLANNFVQRPQFKQAYPDSMTNADFVNKLFDSANLTSTADASLRQTDIAALNSGSETRAQVLLNVINVPEFTAREYNPSFVLMQYFGYLRRDPDQGGYDFWLNVLNNQPNNFRGMVCSFITSAEYQLRFGSSITRTNSDCNQ